MNAQVDTLWSLREMRSGDLDAVETIEDSAYRFPWTRGVFEDCLRVGYSAWIAEDFNGRVAGYALMTMAVGEAHLLNVCVRSDMRRMGVARHFIDHLIDVAREAGIVQMLLEVRPSNAAALELYRHLGFVEIARRKDYYPAPDGREDAIILSCEI